jgi:hypothetical protein
VEPEGSIFWLKRDSRRPYFVVHVKERATDYGRLELYRSSVWKEHFRTQNEFRCRLRMMRKPIDGYSIYEVDGAFESDGGRQVPVWSSELGDKRKRTIALFLDSVGQRHLPGIRRFFARIDQRVGEPLAVLNCPAGLLTGEQVNDSLLAALREARIVVGRDALVRQVGSRRWTITDPGGDGEERERSIYLLQQRGNQVFVVCRVLSRAGGGACCSWDLQSGGGAFRIELDGSKLLVQRYVRLLEERSLVIRFLIDLHAGSDAPTSPLAGFRHAGGSRVEVFERVWDAMVLIGQYLVYNLGTEVNIEEEIWVTYGFGSLWRWKKGNLLVDERLVGGGPGTVRADTDTVRSV